MSKFSLCLIALALIICTSYAQTDGGYTTVPPSQYNDTDIQKFLYYGFDKVYLNAVNSGKLNPSYSASDFTVAKISSIQTQEVSGINYKYNLTFVSTDKAVTIYANYIVYNQAWTNVTTVPSLKYTLYNNKVAGGYTKIPECDWNNTNIQEFLEFGVKNIISLAGSSNKINSNYNFTDFTVSQINSIQEQEVNGVNYKYNVTIRSNDYVYEIKAVFVVFNQAWTNKTSFVSWNYVVKNTRIMQQENNGGWSVVPHDQYYNAAIKKFMEFGIDKVVIGAMNAGKVPAVYSTSDFEVTQINGIWEQVVNGINYKYDLVLESKDGRYTIKTEFVVYNQSWTNTTDMESSDYTVTEN